MSTSAQSTATAEPTEWVRFVATIEPTATDRTRYHAGSEWAMPRSRAELLLARGDVELIDPPAATLAPLSSLTPDAALDADEE